MRESTEIKSRDNEKLKFARRVREGKEEGFIFVEGTRLCRECLQSNTEIAFGLISSGFGEPDLFDNYDVDSTFPLFSVSEKLLASVADTKSPQGIILIAQRPKEITVEHLFKGLAQDLPVVVYLYRINNPSNLGAVIRTAEAAGIGGVIVSENSADPFSPKSLRASMGSAFRLPVVTNTKFELVINSARTNNAKVVAVDVGGSVSHSNYDWKNRTVLVFGSEAEGLPDEIIAKAATKMKIEMKSEVESLNLAVSCGIVLFEAKRQFTG